MYRRKKMKSLLRNYYKWKDLICTTDYQFVMDLTLLQQEYSLPVESLGNYFEILEEKGSEKANKVLRKAHSNRIELFQKLRKERQYKKFIRDIDKLRKKYKLGINWFLNILDFIVSDLESIPRYNLTFKENKDYMTITLNPNTSLNDLTEAWPEIKDKLEKKYTKEERKRDYFSEEKIKNIEIVFKDWELRLKNKFKDNLYYDSYYGEDVIYKFEDLNIVAELYEYEEASIKQDYKRRNKLRVIRHRHKKNVT